MPTYRTVTGRKRSRRCPTPAEIKAQRLRYRLTQTKAAEMIFCTLSAWQQWEAPGDSVKARKMHPAFWELWTMRARWDERKRQKMAWIEACRFGPIQPPAPAADPPETRPA